MGLFQKGRGSTFQPSSAPWGILVPANPQMQMIKHGPLPGGSLGMCAGQRTSRDRPVDMSQRFPSVRLYSTIFYFSHLVSLSNHWRGVRSSRGILSLKFLPADFLGQTRTRFNQSRDKSRPTALLRPPPLHLTNHAHCSLALPRYPSHLLIISVAVSSMQAFFPSCHMYDFPGFFPSALDCRITQNAFTLWHP